MIETEPLGPLLHSFFVDHLITVKGLRPASVRSYRDTLRLFLQFAAADKRCRMTRLALGDLTFERVVGFLKHLEVDRGNHIRTRNQRLAAVHCLFEYIAGRAPEMLVACQRVAAVPMKRVAPAETRFLERDEVSDLLRHLPRDGRLALRDRALLLFLYNTGARVQELIDLSVGDVRLDSPAQLRLLGKGRKMRAVPLMNNTVQLLRDHLQENHCDRPEQFDKPLFPNARNQRLSRSGIRYILQKYLAKAQGKLPSLNRAVSPHTLRHAKGMHMLQSGISLDMIRDFLGHVDVKTTQIYARANLEMKRQALEKMTDPSPVPTIPSWQQNKDLLNWLRSL